MGWDNALQCAHSCRTVVQDVKIENNVGDAIVHRIIRAHRDGTPWKCCIVIPLLPGFTFPVDHSDASAVRQVH
jgi:phospholipase D1/2